MNPPTRPPAALLLGAALCCIPTACAPTGGSGNALHLSRINLSQAVNTAREHRGEGAAVEVELGMMAGQPLWNVELLQNGRVKIVTVDGISGAVLRMTVSEPDGDEVEMLKRFEALDPNRRVTLQSALVQARRTIRAGRPVEVDLESRDALVFNIRLKVGNLSRWVRIPVKKGVPEHD